ncbi:hypothetical protein BSL78_24306 [Apostichopus japonicus]|uniref:Uncharacterized protein n=1 Tax=Stichopus japonicus TaxID=307972 RepID=A0A2G8JT20_STIJA|nr:hypothetical protein BSL78_24306 [Apostichopus japonicus]
MEHEPLLGDKRKGYRVSMWLHLQLIPLGVLSWKEKKTSVRSILSETCTEDLGCSINEGKTTLLDDSFRLEKQTFDLRSSLRRTYFGMSAMLLLLCAISTGYVFCFTMIRYFGQTHRIIHFISMTTYSVNLMILPLGCSLSRLYFFFVSKETIRTLDCCSIAWCLWMFLEEPFVVRRLRFLPVSAKNRPFSCTSFLLISFIMCVISSFMSYLVYYDTPKYSRCDGQSLCVLIISGTIGVIFFSLFCNYVYMLRTSLREELLFLVKYCYCNEGNVQACRKRIVSMVRDYRVIRSVTNLWMQVVLPASVLGLVVHLKWNYLVFTSNDTYNDVVEPGPQKIQNLILMSIYIFMGKIMVTCLPS